MKLSSQSFEKLSEALEDAFVQRGDFERLARCIDRRLPDIASDGARVPDLVLALIECAESADTVDRLVACAQEQVPTNRLLAAIDVGTLESAPEPERVVSDRPGGGRFKTELVEALGYLEAKGMQVLAGNELAGLLREASDRDAETLLLALLGTVRTDLADNVVGEIVPVISDALRRRLGNGKRPDDMKLDLARARLRRIDLSDLDLHEADLAFADLRHADLTNANLWRSRAYGVNATKAGLSRANLEEARWHAAQATEARFHDCRMVSAFFKEADLTGAEFQRSRLQGAHFDMANLSGARFEQANLADAFFTEATIDRAAAASLARALNWQDAHFDDAARRQIADAAG